MNTNAMRIARLSAHMTLKDVAEKLNVNLVTVWNWEHGKSSPRVDDLIRFCDVVGVDARDLLCP